MPEAIYIADHEVRPGTRRQIDISLGTLSTLTPVSMHVYVVHGESEGPVMFLSGAIHGDEINGVEIVRRVMSKATPEKLSGTLIAVPIVNAFGFINESRYLPDRRDLNRVFPGSARGSQASRLANTFMTEIVEKCDYGIDLHTASRGRYNLPHVRGDFTDPEIHRIASAFGAPVYYHSLGQDGTVRRAANEQGVRVILYEAGEAGRFDHGPISIGVDGTLRVMKALGMIRHAPAATESVECTGTKWVRAKRGGLLRLDRLTGEPIRKRQKLGTIGDALGEETVRVVAPVDGIIISHATNPLVNQGDAVIHIAKTD